MTKIATAISQGQISEPYCPFLPQDFPMKVAVVAVQLLKGCRPPLGGGVRLGVGTGPTEDSAKIRASFEAIERFSLQYDQSVSLKKSPLFAIRGKRKSLTLAELCIGSPIAGVGTKGTAAGDRLEDAIERASLEAIEHHTLAHWDDLNPQRLELESIQDRYFSEKNCYLKNRQKELHVEIVTLQDRVFIVRSILQDSDGNRPTFGSSAAKDISIGINKSSDEAILSWRNLLELERNGKIIDGTSIDSAWRQYKGLDDPIFALKPQDHFERAELYECEKVDPLLLLSEVADCRVQVFDMTSPRTKIPVARVVLG